MHMPMNRRSRQMASPRDGPGLLLSLPLELREIVWTQATLASLSLSRECCKQFHVEVENVFEREAATRRAAVAVEGDRHIAEQPQPGESGYGWAVRTLFAQRSHSVRTAGLAAHQVLCPLGQTGLARGTQLVAALLYLQGRDVRKL